MGVGEPVQRRPGEFEGSVQFISAGGSDSYANTSLRSAGFPRTLFVDWGRHVLPGLRLGRRSPRRDWRIRAGNRLRRDARVVIGWRVYLVSTGRHIRAEAFL